MMTSEWVCSSIGLREWDRLLSSSISFLFNEDENHHPYIFFFSFPRPRKDDDTRRSSKRNIKEQRDDHHPEITTTEEERKRERKNGQKEFDRENVTREGKKKKRILSAKTHRIPVDTPPRSLERYSHRAPFFFSSIFSRDSFLRRREKFSRRAS